MNHLPESHKRAFAVGYTSALYDIRHALLLAPDVNLATLLLILSDDKRVNTAAQDWADRMVKRINAAGLTIPADTPG